jgi:hypothetical protein
VNCLPAMEGIAIRRSLSSGAAVRLKWSVWGRVPSSVFKDTYSYPRSLLHIQSVNACSRSLFPIRTCMYLSTLIYARSKWWCNDIWRQSVVLRCFLSLFSFNSHYEIISAWGDSRGLNLDLAFAIPILEYSTPIRSLPTFHIVIQPSLSLCNHVSKVWSAWIDRDCPRPGWDSFRLVGILHCKLSKISPVEPLKSQLQRWNSSPTDEAGRAAMEVQLTQGSSSRDRWNYGRIVARPRSS